MSNTNERIAFLLNNYMAQKLGSEEIDELMNWLAVESNKDQFAEIASPILFTGDVDTKTTETEIRVMIGNILQADQPLPVKRPVAVHRIHLLRTAWFRFAAAAVIILIAGALIWINGFKTTGGSQVASKQTGKEAPSSMLAMITLGDGRQINLESTAPGTLAREGNVTIEKLSDGRIVYNGVNENSLIYNTISVPRGSKITNLTLSDGTIVWLNSSSSLKYPVAFTTNERRVQITGEAYFDVAKNARKQFIVDAGNSSVEVLGTSFNINSYDNEGSKKITLVNGRVRVLSNGEQLVLDPGQQAQAAETLSLLSSANIDDVIAWKNGKFYFDNTSIEEVMRELERWYDIEVVFKEKPTKGFEGTIPRSLNIQNVLKILEATGEVRFEMEGNRVIVMK